MAALPSDSRQAPRIAAVLVVAGLIANVVIARMAYGSKARIFFGKDWMGDFIKHTMSFPGPPLAPSMFQNLIDHFRDDIAINVGVLGHFHNMPLTVMITFVFRPLMSIVDPVAVYLAAAAIFYGIWGYFCHHYAWKEVRPQALGIALCNYPVFVLLERGNLFAGITAVCLLVVLCRREQDWIAVILLAVAANIRPNVAILALPLLSYDRKSLVFIVKTALAGAVLGLGCLAVDGWIYPAYTLPNIMRGLSLYNDGYVLGPFAIEFGSSLWGAARHFVPVTGRNVALCTLAGLVPLGIAWLGRNRFSYAAMCFLAIAACTLSTAILADYHLLVFVVPLLLVKRDDPAFWPILLGSCWMLIPKNYNPAGELSWQVYLNPGGLVVAVAFVVAAFRGKVTRQSSPLVDPTAQS